MEPKPLSQYLRRIEEARDRRAQSIERLAQLVGYLHQRMTFIEFELATSMDQFNHPSRHLAGKRLHATWSKLPSLVAAGPASLSWFAASPGSPAWKRTQKPKPATLSARTIPEFLPFQVALVERMTEFMALRARGRTAVSRLAKAFKAPSFPIEGSRNDLPAWVSAHRQRLVESAVSSIRDAGVALDLIDAELSDLMAAFNKAARRYSVSIVCSWECDGRSLENLIGPRGPVFSMTTTTLDRRRRRRLTSPKGSDTNPISTRLLKQARYYDAPEDVRAKAAAITEVTNRRNIYVEQLRAAAAAVSPILKVEFPSQ